jgi:hypothetical protein
VSAALGEGLEGLELAVIEQPERVAPLTGELVDLRDPLAVARAALSALEVEQEVRAFRKFLEEVLRLEAARQGSKTLHLGATVAEVSGGSRWEWDAEKLAGLLREAGMPEERIAEIVVETVERKVNAREASRAASANPAYREAVEASRMAQAAPWRVAIKREV